jgi:hypothetical protein
VVADVLSRRDAEDVATVMAMSAPLFQLFDDLRQELSSDPALLELVAAVLAGEKGDH